MHHSPSLYSDGSTLQWGFKYMVGMPRISCFLRDAEPCIMMLVMPTIMLTMLSIMLMLLMIMLIILTIKLMIRIVRTMFLRIPCI